MKRLFSVLLCTLLLLSLAAPIVSAADADGEAYYALGKPVIDGEIDDLWKDVPMLSAAFGDSTEDIHGNARFLWDEDYLYALIVIDDDTPADDDTPGAESSDIFMAEDGIGSDGFVGDGEYGVTISRQGTSYITYIDGEFYSTDETLNSFVEKAVVDNGKGYLIEERIAFRTIKGEVGKIVGLNFTLNNDTDNDAQRNNFRSWADDSNPYWSNSEFLNKLQFSAVSVGEAPAAAAPSEEAPAAVEEPAAAEEPAPAAIEPADAPAPAAAPKTADAGIIAAAAVLAIAAGCIASKRK